MTTYQTLNAPFDDAELLSAGRNIISGELNGLGYLGQTLTTHIIEDYGRKRYNIAKCSQLTDIQLMHIIRLWQHIVEKQSGQ